MVVQKAPSKIVTPKAKPTRERLIEDTIKALKNIEELDVESLSRESELGVEMNFSQAIPTLKKLSALYRQVDPKVLDKLAYQVLSNMRMVTYDFNQLVRRIREFSVANNNSADTRAEILSGLNELYDKAAAKTCDVISFTAAQRVLSNDYDSQLKVTYEQARTELTEQIKSMQTKALEVLDGYTQRSDELYDQQKKKLEQIEADDQKRREDAENALAEIRKHAAEAGVSQQAEYFKEAQEHHSRKATVWLIVSVGVAVLLGAVAVASIFIEIDVKDNYQLAQLIMGKVILVSTITFMLVMAIKSYNAHRHNAVVNKQRQNSLSTYKALVEAAGDQANKDIVLSKAAESIFGSQCTGFAKASGSDSDGMAIINVQQPQVKMPMDGS